MSRSRIVIRLPNWVGDGALAVPAVRSLQAQHPQAEMILVGTGRSLPVYGRWPSVSLLSVERKDLRETVRLVGHLKLFRAGEALLLSPSFRSALPFFLAGIERRVGFAGDGRRHLLTEAVAPPSRNRHLSRQYLELAARLGADREAPLDPSVPIGADEREAARKRLLSLGFEPKGTIAFCPGATYGETKRWPHPAWVELGRTLAAEGWRLLLLGGESERGAGEQIASAIGRSAKSLAGSLDLRMSLALFSELAGSVSNDSGAMHLAAAAGCPVLGLFGSTNPDWTGPLGRHAHTIRLGLTCSPCYSQSCPTEIECLSGLTADSVAGLFRQRIGRKGDD